jgi:surface protein
MSFMFNGCASLTSVPLFNTASVTATNQMFNECRSLTSVPALNVSAVTSASNFEFTFGSCFSLQNIDATGFNYSFSIANCQLSATELNAIYTALPTVVGQTITVTGNYGTATDDPLIAIGKGWAVSG